MGHVRDYSIGDAYARFRRARGDAVLFGFGFDAFGLPAEMAAIERGVRPADWVEARGERMLEQMKPLGFSFDYDRVFYSSDESQYRWSQWLFVTLLEAGLIYRDDATVDWCDSCQTTLAALQVEDGRCWRCHNKVRLIRRPTWFLRVTPVRRGERRQPRAARELGRALAQDPALHPRAHRRGRARPRRPRRRRPHRLHPARAASAAAAPSCSSRRATPRSSAGPATRACREQLDELRSGGWERSARDASAVPVIDTGASIAGPAGAELPVLVSPIVDARYGPTAVLGIPVARRGRRGARRARAEGRRRRRGGGRRRRGASAAQRYRASDFSIGRQRYWGTPIPVVHCESCGAGRRSRSRTCRSCCRATSSRPARATRWPSAPTSSTSSARAAASPAKRETDTLDCHFDALWLWVPAAVPPEDRDEEMFTHPDLQRWLPSERLVAGNDSGGFVFDQRVVTKALRDIGPFAFIDRRRALRRLPLPRDGRRRRPQDEQAPRQRRRPRRARRRARRRHRPASRSSTRPARRRR